MKRIFIDVREASEFARGHVNGALSLSPVEIMRGAKALAGVPKDTELVLYCVSGSRSNAAINILKQLGFTNLINGVNKDRVRAKYGV